MSEDTKDCTRLPVVAWQVEFPLGNGAKVYEQRPSWAYESYGDLAYVTHELCRLTDAQARLTEKDARIAELAAHARGKNKALANALKEIERLKRTIETGLDNELALVGERTELRAQLEQLQAAPAERGVDDIRPAAARAYGFLWHVNNEPGTPSPMYSADKAAYRARIALRDQLTSEERGKAIHAVGIELGRYEPATADSDVREVSE